MENQHFASIQELNKNFNNCKFSQLKNKYIKNNKEISLIKKAYERGKQLYLVDKRKQIVAKRQAEAQSDNNGTRKNTNKNNIR